MSRSDAKNRWTEKPDAQDYPAAEEYLSLVIAPAAAKTFVRRLRNAPIIKRKAKDLLRASALPRWTGTQAWRRWPELGT